MRIGVTVGKKNAPLSVDRAIVKRQLREIFRLHLPMLRQVLPDGVGLDVSLRLKVPLKGLSPKSRTDLKRRLRADADGLLNEVVRRSKPRRSNKHESSQGSDVGDDSSLSVNAFSMGGTGMPLLAYLLELCD